MKKKTILMKDFKMPVSVPKNDFTYGNGFIRERLRIETRVIITRSGLNIV